MPLLLVLGLLGCTGGSTPEPAPADPAAQGWISEVALVPRTFAELTAAEREGWIALHAHRYGDAVAAFSEARSRARAEWQLAVLHDDLSRLAGHANDQLFSEWQERGSLPSGAPQVATFAILCTGIGDPERYTSRDALLARLLGGESDGSDQPDGSDLLALDRGVLAELEGVIDWRPEAHQAAVAGDPARLLEVAAEPVVSLQADGFERRFYDPCVHRSLSRGWSTRLAADLGTDRDAEPWQGASAWAGGDVGGRLFSPWLRPEDLTVDLAKVDRAGLVGASAPSLSLPDLGPADEVQPARDLVQALDAELAGWRTALADAADADGRALLGDLGLVDRYRQELLVVLAREALLEDRPNQARVLVQLARDATARGVGPTNSPQLFALLAEAELRTGHTREALDALQPLVVAYPEARGLQEVMGDLAVLRGLDRHGDSREL